MKKKNILLIILGIICAMPLICCAELRSFIEHNGITWTFDGDYETGKFVNGDYWVIGPVNITSIDPPCHITISGEKDEAGFDYIYYPNVTGAGSWAILENWYRHTTVYSSDISKLTVGQRLLIKGTTGADSSKVNGCVASIEAVYADSFVLSFYPERWDLNSASDISGGTFGGIVINGSQINPSVTTILQGYNSSAPNYSPSINAAWTLSNDNPDKVGYITVPANSSLISTSSKKERTTAPSINNHSFVKRAQILTVLPPGAFNGVTPSDCFRPAYFGTDKSIEFNLVDIDFSVLKRITPVGSGIASMSAMEEQFKRPWIRVGQGWQSRYIHPTDNMPDYYFNYETNMAALVLNLDTYTNEQKKMLLVYYIQHAIDMYGQYKAGSRGNSPEGGVFSGHLLPILVAGKVLNYSPMLDICAKSGDYLFSPKPGGGNYSPGDPPPDYKFLQELDQTYYVSQLEIDISNAKHALQWMPGLLFLNDPAWTGIEPMAPGPVFTAADIGKPDYGMRHVVEPNIITNTLRPVYKDYRSLNSNPYTSTALVLLIMGLKEKVNHNAFFDYADRWATCSGNIINWPEMWAAYRASYGPIWTSTGSTNPQQDNPNPNNQDNPINPSDIPEITELKVLNNVLKGAGAQATVKLLMAESGNASVKIYDSKGREIMTLWDGYKDAGEYDLIWTGVDGGGSKIGSGVYVVHMNANGYKQTKKIVVVK